jgi:hypothetical protein
MFSQFKFKATQEQLHPGTAQDRLASGVAAKCKKMQLQWANYLQRETEHVSGKAKRFGLFLFCLLAGSYCGFLAFDSFIDSESKPFPVTNIKVPAHAGKAREEAVQPLVTKEMYQRVQRFRGFIDSLCGTAKGRMARDSILHSRPGLLDSILVIEHLFHAQSSKQ